MKELVIEEMEELVIEAMEKRQEDVLSLRNKKLEEIVNVKLSPLVWGEVAKVIHQYQEELNRTHHQTVGAVIALRKLRRMEEEKM